VVARWAHEREAAAVDRAEGAACGEQRGVVARRRRDGVRVEERRDLERLDPVEVAGVVDALDVLTRGGRPFDDLEPLEQDGQPLA
jgi:hypothetical protein